MIVELLSWLTKSIDIFEITHPEDFEPVDAFGRYHAFFGGRELGYSEALKDTLDQVGGFMYVGTALDGCLELKVFKLDGGFCVQTTDLYATNITLTRASDWATFLAKGVTAHERKVLEAHTWPDWVTKGTP